MSSMGELTFFLGLQVKQKDDGIFISQDKYVGEILKKFGFSNLRTASTPIETNKALAKDKEGEDVDVHLYRSMIGSLMYLTSSRPDIMFSICACSRFQVQPKVSHMFIVKRIFRYLKGRPKLGLWYPKDSPFILEAFSDSDYAGASLDKKSTIGGVGDSCGKGLSLLSSLDGRRVNIWLPVPMRQDTMRGAPTQTRSGRVLEKHNEPPLSEGHTSGSEEDMMEQNFELTANVLITPHVSPLPGGYTLGSDGNLKAHEMIIKKDSEIVKAKGERRSLALKAKKESSDEGQWSTSRCDLDQEIIDRHTTESNVHFWLVIFSLTSMEKLFQRISIMHYIILNKHTGKIKELLNVTFDETPPPSKTSPLVDDYLDEDEAIKVTEKKNLEKTLRIETLGLQVVNIKESRNHPLEKVIGTLTKELLAEFYAMRVQDELDGKLNFFFGLQIKQMEDGIFFNQSKYITEMLKKFGLEDSKPMKTPMSYDTRLTEDEELSAFVPATKRILKPLILKQLSVSSNTLKALCTYDYGILRGPA
ncbi:hypothetical protein Tco_0777431 [Tanacetum coccineum]